MYEVSRNVYFENSEMNLGYPNILTPPSSGNEGSPYSVITSPIYGLSDCLMELDTVSLKILEQPVDKFRFRYISEMAGTHGSLCGMNSERNRKATFPTVQLCNYNGKAKIRCSLYQYNAIEDLRNPHAHRLMKRYDNIEKEDPHDLDVSEDNNYQAVFHSMGIIHTAKKYIEEHLIKKKEFLKSEEIHMYEGIKRPLTKAEKAEIKSKANDEAKKIDLNKVCLRFDAFVEIGNGRLKQLCEPVFSHTINNLKSALTGELKIVRMDHCTSPCTGGREIFILVEKVTKKNIKIRFVELDDDEKELWSKFGDFNDLDVHHQYAIVFKTPAYKDTNITENKKVYIELLRPSDNARSERREFTYVPNKNLPAGSKRPRIYNSSSSYTNSSNCSLPVILPGNNSSEGIYDINISAEISKFCDSNEVQKILELEDIDDLYDKTIAFDAPNMKDDEKVIKPKSTVDSQPIKDEVNDFINFLKSRPSPERIKVKLITLFQNNEDIIFHNAIIWDMKQIVHILSKLINQTNPDLINTQDSVGYTGLHLAVLHNNLEIVQILLKNNAKTNIQDNNGNTPLHLAIKENVSLKITSALIKATPAETLNLENLEGEIILYLAAKRNLLHIVKELCAAGADVNAVLKTNGRNILHVAVENCQFEMVEYLIRNTKICPNVKDFSGYNPLQMATVLLKDGNNESMEMICNLLKSNMQIGVNDIDIKEEPMSEDEEDQEQNMKIKDEFSPEMIKIMYKNIKEIPDLYLKEVAKIINDTDSWYHLADLLDVKFLLDTNVIDKKNPALSVLNIALANGDTVLTIRDFLENLGIFQAVSILDNMVQNLKNK